MVEELESASRQTVLDIDDRRVRFRLGTELDLRCGCKAIVMHKMLESLDNLERDRKQTENDKIESGSKGLWEILDK
jgi:hypothetical protein